MRVTSFFYPAIALLCLCAGCRTESAKPPTQEPATKKTFAQIQADALVQEMCHAAAKGNVQRVQSLIAEGVSVAVRDDGWQRTPLHFAAEAGQAEVARLLIAGGADVNARDPINTTPLHLAAYNGRKEMIELLLASGVNVNARGGEYRDTALHKVVMGGNYDSIAAEELVRVRRPDVDEEDDLYLDLQKEYSEQLVVEITQLLLAHGADARAEDRIGATVLDCAIMDAPVQAIDMLLTHGADPVAKGEDGLSCLHTAVLYGRKDVIPVLLKWGANANAWDGDRQTPLHEAVWRGDTATVELLIAHGAALNAGDRNGDTPAHIAALIGDAALYDLLISKGTNVAAKNRRGLTPPDCARLAPPQEMIRLSEDGVHPYSVIITDVRAIRTFLTWNMASTGLRYEQLWIPTAEDVRQAETIMRLGKPNDRLRIQRGSFGPNCPPADLDRYNREYCGFMKGKARYIVCHMSLDMSAAGQNKNPPGNQFTYMWGPCSLIQVVIASDKQQVLGAMCDGM
jgi:ankyrin repeat protein